MIFISFSIEKIIIPYSHHAPLSHLNSCTPTKSNLYLDNSLAAAVSEPVLYRLLTLHVPNLMSLFHCLGHTNPGLRKVSMICNKISFYGEELSTPHPTPKLQDQTLSVVRNCLFNIFRVTFHIRGRSSIHNLRTHHAVVTGTHLSWIHMLPKILKKQNKNSTTSKLMTNTK